MKLLCVKNINNIQQNRFTTHHNRVNLKPLPIVTVPFTGFTQNVVKDLIELLKKPIRYCQNIAYKKNEDIIKLFNDLKMSEGSFVDECMKHNHIGYGQEGIVYDIPFKDFDGFVIKISHDFFNNQIIKPISKVNDNFKYKNFGQPVAKIGEMISILKKAEGIPLDRLSDSNSENLAEEVKKYYAKLSTIPQKTFDEFVSNIKFMNNNGYYFDGGNSGNVLYDVQTQRFNIIDINKEKWKNSIGDILSPFFIFDKNEIETPNTKIFQDKIMLIRKIFIAAKKQKISKTKDDYLLEHLFKKFKGTSFESAFDELYTLYFHPSI